VRRAGQRKTLFVIMADLKRQAGFVGKLLEFDFEQLYA
jgi:hypothetical protein